MEILFFWIGGSVVVGAIAANKGHNGIGWFFLLLLISPLLAGAFALVAKNIAAENAKAQELVDTRVCPFCAERVKSAAKVCRYCQRDLPSTPDATPPSSFGAQNVIGAAPPIVENQIPGAKMNSWIGVLVAGIAALAVIVGAAERVAHNMQRPEVAAPLPSPPPQTFVSSLPSSSEAVKACAQKSVEQYIDCYRAYMNDTVGKKLAKSAGPDTGGRSTGKSEDDISANAANAYLLTLSENERAVQLAKAVGGGCKGRHPFYKGIGKRGFAKGKAFWDVECANRQSYEIEVDPDGHNSVLECAVLQKVGAGRCFLKLAD